MKDAVVVILNIDNKKYYVDVNNIEVKKNDNVLVEMNGLILFGTIVTDVMKVPKNLIDSKIIKIADKKEIEKNLSNEKLALEAKEKINKLINKYKLDMKLLDTYFTFDKDQLLIYFYAQDRVDFRKLAKDLAAIYKTRIELRQIGVRDKAQKIGGYGSCGQKLCCSRFIKNFDSVYISMAKNQNLSLNPTKINGICGRLLCCLKYENETYKEAKKNLPNVGKMINTKYGEGKVVEVDALNNKYKVEIPLTGIVEIDGTN